MRHRWFLVLACGWILWRWSVPHQEWYVIDGFVFKWSCMREAKKWGAPSYDVMCLPDTVDPRPRK